MTFGYNPSSKVDHDSLATQTYHEIPRADVERSNEMIYVDHGLPIIRPTLVTLLMDAAIYQHQNDSLQRSFEMMNQPSQQGVHPFSSRVNNTDASRSFLGMNQTTHVMSQFNRVNDVGMNDENLSPNEIAVVPNAFMGIDQPPSVGRQGRLCRNSLVDIIEDALDIISFEDDLSLLQQQ